MSNIILSAKNIYKSFQSTSRNKLEVLKGVSLEIEIKKITIIVGASGAGKSTLLHLLGGGIKRFIFHQFFPDHILVGTGSGHFFCGVADKDTVSNTRHHVLGEVIRLAITDHIRQHGAVT